MSTEFLEIGDLVAKPPKPRSEEEIIAKWEGCLVQPFVSIHCITYNHATYIEDALNSFLMQETDFPFEIWVYDDASTDGTQEVIKKYKERYPKLLKTMLQKENQLSKARRPLSFFTGKTQAKYIAFCDGDDYWLDKFKLKKQVAFLEANPDYVISGHDAFVINEKGQLVKKSKLPDIHKLDFNSKDVAEGRTWILTMSWVYRNVIQDFAPERYMVRNGDSFLVSLLGGYGKSHYHHDVEPAAYRVHSDGVWSSLSEDKRLDDHTNTWFWMYRYYKRIGDLRLADVFYTRFQRNVFRGAGFADLLKAVIRKFLFLDMLIAKLNTICGVTVVLRIRRLLFKN